jgi:hypothetical protein
MDAGFLSGLEGGFFPRLAINFVCIFVLVRLIYYPAYRRTDLFLSFFALNLIIFLIAYVLNRVEISLGAAFGLFAVFSMLRYRTEGISTTDMTYLFTGIALGLIMAVSDADWALLLVFGAVILLTIRLLESGLLVPRELCHEILYDKIQMVNIRDRAALIEDLRLRTGLNIRRVEVREIDLLRDAATLMVYYPAEDSIASSAESA